MIGNLAEAAVPNGKRGKGRNELVSVGVKCLR